MSGDATIELRAHSRDLGKISLARLPKSFNRACFLLINTTQSYRLNEGAAPILRATKIAKCFSSFGYEVYSMINPHCLMFAEFFQIFLKRTKNHLIFFSIGRGGIESSSSLSFDDEPMEDDQFLSIVNNQRSQNLKVTLICENCANNSVFQNIESFSPNTVLIGCFNTNNQSSKHDIFVEHFIREVKNRKQITNMQLHDSLRIIMNRNQIQLSVFCKPDELLNQPFAEYNPKKEMNELIN